MHDELFVGKKLSVKRGLLSLTGIHKAVFKSLLTLSFTFLEISAPFLPHLS